MLVVLPPSETKWEGPQRGAPVDLDALSLPALTGARERVLDALVTASARPGAAELLGAGPRLAATVAANTSLRTRPAARAAQVYRGVLYDALDLPSLPAPARRRVLVVSALWGALTPGDRIPGYRLSMGTDLPGVGPLAGFWRPHLAAALAPAGVVVDCRSSTYAAAWQPSREVAGRTAAVRVSRDGRSVSHDAKRTRGLLARHLLTRPGRVPRTVAELHAAAAEAFAVRLQAPVRAGAPWVLDVEAA
ncbi:peroxide stress protein YaaA [Kineococcus glutinatus]|uniref:Peroxide stress protein YaaA n=1 Tax=Kineococcus glutinatus TaxID=1070872 RepID=A0ABP9I1U7_9ACTN